MIEQIKSNSVNSQSRLGKAGNNTPNQLSFKNSPLDLAVSAIQLCETNPMINVAVLDLATAIIPRTVVETETNPYAGLEAFRRESSGLIINCMIPGLIVAGVAKMLSGGIMGKKTGMAKCWANEDTINLVKKYWENASEIAKDSKGNILYQDNKQKAKVYNTIKNILADTEGIDGEKTVYFNDTNKFNFDEEIKQITDEVFNSKPKAGFLSKEWRENKKTIRKAKRAAKEAGIDYIANTPYAKIVSQTHAAENIKIKGTEYLDKKSGKMVTEYFSQSLGDILGNAPKLLKELASGKFTNVDDFAHRATNLVKGKSILGLGVVLALAFSAQPINRWITKKTSGKEGAPIYKDFTQAQSRQMSAKDKAGLATQKLISASTMVGVALLSIMKSPNPKMFKTISQFKGIFPSMDQARIISTATFVSRMLSSQDKNDLREATVRDIATFSAFYFLGDYVSKGIATGIQAWSKKHPKEGKFIELINVKEPLKEGSNKLQKFWHWTKNTALKSSDELSGAIPKKMRAICQLGNLAFSLLALGILIPKMNRKKTDKEHEKELKQATA